MTTSVDPPAHVLQDNLQANADAQPATSYCSLCPKWSATGTAKEAREAAEKHRREEHPELLARKKVVRRKRAFSQALSAEREAEIERERRQRMHELGIDPGEG